MNKKELSSVVTKLAFQLFHAKTDESAEFLRNRVLRGLNSAQRKEVADYLEAETANITDPEAGKQAKPAVEAVKEEGTGKAA